MEVVVVDFEFGAMGLLLSFRLFGGLDPSPLALSPHVDSFDTAKAGAVAVAVADDS